MKKPECQTLRTRFGTHQSNPRVGVDQMHFSRRLVHVGALLIVVMAIGVVLITDFVRREQARRVEARTLQISRGLQVNLEMFIKEHTTSLSLMSALDRDGLIRSEKDFSYFATQIVAGVTGFRSISATNSDYQLIHQFPPRNRQHDLRQYPDRFAFAEKARTTRSAVVTDPVRLILDGRPGVAVYVPIYDGEVFKGLIIGTFDVNRIASQQLKPIFEDSPFSISTESGTNIYVSGEIPNNSLTGPAIPVQVADKVWVIRSSIPTPNLKVLSYDRAVLLTTLLLFTALCVTILYATQLKRVAVQGNDLVEARSGYQSVVEKLDTKSHENLELYRQLEQTQGDLVKATRLATLGELSAVIAHEIRNPLTALLNCFHALQQSSPADAENTKLMEVGMKEAMRINNIASEFLSFARPTRVSPKRTELAELLDSVIIAFQQDSRWQHRIAVIRECRDPGCCPVAFLDPELMRQVLWNVTLNAAQAIEGSGKIQVSCHKENGHAAITIKDNGRGIPGPIQTRVFEPFFSTKSSGVGLGLFIVRNIVEEHGGYVSLDSNEGKGTEIKIIIPLDLPEVADVASASR